MHCRWGGARVVVVDLAATQPAAGARSRRTHTIAHAFRAEMASVRRLKSHIPCTSWCLSHLSLHSAPLLTTLIFLYIAIVGAHFIVSHVCWRAHLARLRLQLLELWPWCRVSSGVWRPASGVWRLPPGVWHLVSGVWLLVPGIWRRGVDRQ